MNKIPIKIVEFSDGDKKIKEVMIDLIDVMQIQSNYKNKIEKFRNKYFDLINNAEKLFFQSNLDKTKKIKNLKSSTCWQIGNLFLKFHNDVNHDFIITNYSDALQRDFGRSRRYIEELMIFSDIFKKQEISDNIPMAIYRALVWRKNQLDALGLLKSEKTRLIKTGKNNCVPGREKYKIELIESICGQTEKNNSKNKINNHKQY